MFKATIAGSLPKPFWLAETNKLWPEVEASGAELAAAKRDARWLWIKAQEDAGLDIVTDGEQSRQHFVHGFSRGGRRHRLRAQGRNGYPQRSLQGNGAAGGRSVAPERSGA